MVKLMSILVVLLKVVLKVVLKVIVKVKVTVLLLSDYLYLSELERTRSHSS